VVQSPPEPLAKRTRPRSSSLSSVETIEDISHSLHEDVSYQLWSTAQNEKSSHSVNGCLSEQGDRELSTSPLPESSPEPSASIFPPALPIAEKTSSVPAPIASASFSSLTRSSQPSKRIVSDGQEKVLNSDSDSDNDSLPDITFMPKKRRITSAPEARAAEPEPKKIYSFSLDALIEEEKQAAAMDARIEAARSRLQVNGSHQTHQNGHVVTRESVMACLVENADHDEGNARRVRDAFSRTEALDLHEVWHFFDEDLPPRSKHSFPTYKSFNNGLASILNDPAKRHQALATGFLTRLAAHTSLPREVMLWMMEEVCREPKEVLVQSYINVLDASLAKHDQVINPTRIESLFKQMGARETALSPGSTATANREPVGFKKRSISGRVHSLVALLERVAKHMSSESRERALHLLALASFDDSVVQDGHLGVRIEASIDTLLKAIPEEHFEQEILRISRGLFTAVTSPVLRHQLISALPCYTSQTHRFRRQLALAFALKSTRRLEALLDNHKLINHILLSLRQSKHYRVGKNTDYTVMDAYFAMLDVAVDIGFSDFNFAEASPAESGIDAAEDRPKGVRRSLFAPRIMRKAPENAKEKAFNEDVDKLAKEIRDIMAQILDSGASHMKRTECKATADRLVQRLENGVRTKAKPAKDWYNKNDEGVALMEGFVTKEVRKDPVDTVMGDVRPEVQLAEQSAIEEDVQQTDHSATSGEVQQVDHPAIAEKVLPNNHEEDQPILDKAVLLHGQEENQLALDKEVLPDSPEEDWLTLDKKVLPDSNEVDQPALDKEILPDAHEGNHEVQPTSTIAG
jgi:hypothetical protein